MSRNNNRKLEWPSTSARTRTKQISFWLRNSILTGSSEYSSSSNAGHASDSSNHVPLQHESSHDNDNEWIAQPQNIDEALLCFYNGTRTEERPLFDCSEESHQDYDWLLDGELDTTYVAARPQLQPHAVDPLQLTLENLSLEEDLQLQLELQLEADQQLELQHQPPPRARSTMSRLFKNSNLAKLLPLTVTQQTNKTPLHKFVRTSQLLMLQELERQPILALEEEHSLLSSDDTVPFVIQCHVGYDTNEIEITPTPSSPFTLYSQDNDHTLPLSFYQKNYDPIEHVLQSMPHWRSNKSTATVDDFITKLLSLADECQSTINAELNCLIISKQSEISQGIQQLHSIDREIGSSILHWNQARHFVDSARKQAFLQESLILIQNSLLRADYQIFLKIIDQCSDIVALEQQLSALVLHNDNDANMITASEHWKPHSFLDYQRYLSMANDLKALALDDGGLHALKCFAQLRQRSSIVLTTRVGTLLHRELERVLTLSCREQRFSNVQYSTLLQVHLKLQLHIACWDAPSSQMDSWSLCILKSLTNGADECITRALLLIAASFENNAKPNSGLPESFHQLCMELTNILHSYYLIEQWHRSPFDLRNEDSSFLHRSEISDIHGTGSNAVGETPNARDPSSSTHLCKEDAKRLHEIRTELVRHRHLIWNHCESLLERLIDAHLIRDSHCRESSLELSSLTYLMQIEHLMESVVQDFIGSSISCSDFDPETFFRGLRYKLAHVYRRYLHLFHCEAVGVISTMLKNESWQLISVDSIETPPTNIMMFIEHPSRMTHAGKNKSDVLFSQAGAVHERFFSNFVLEGNVFTQMKIQNRSQAGSLSPSDVDLDAYQDLYRAIRDATARLEDTAIKHFGGTHTAVNRLVHVTVKYLHLLKALPLIGDDVAVSLSLLYDFYFVHILRFCTGNEAHENALLTVEYPTTASSRIIPSSEPSHHRRLSSTNPSKVLDKPKPSRTSPTREAERHKSSRTLSFKNMEARIASAMPSESMRYLIVRNFTEGAQERLKSDDISVNVESVVCPESRNEILDSDDTFIRRYCAAKSCLFVATLLEGVSNLSSLGTLQVYAKSVTAMVSTFTDAATRMAAVRAVGGERVVQDIIRVGRGWEEAKIMDGSSVYIDDLCNRCSLLWARLSFLENYSLATCAWESIVSAAFLSLLEGFSNVFVCSTEGRALMSMDLASFAAGISSRAVKNNLEGLECRCPPPSIPSISRGMQYVDAVVKAFYFGEHDLMKWIEDNRESYRLEHCLTLVISSVGGRRSIPYVNEMLDAVKLLYCSPK